MLFRSGEDGLRFQLIFDLCEDLRVDYQVQQLVPNYLQRMLGNARSGARHPETGPYYLLALTSIEHALAAGRGDGMRDERLAPLLDPRATIEDAWRIASRIYAEGTLPPVSDLEAFQAAYLPGRGPNAARLVHPQQREEQQQQQTQSGAEGEQQPQEQGEDQSESAQNAEAGNQQYEIGRAHV